MIIFLSARIKLSTASQAVHLLFINLAGPKPTTCEVGKIRIHLLAGNLKIGSIHCLLGKLGLLMIWDSENFFTTI